MISKNKIKFIRSLETKKSRDAERLFVAEGPKVIDDILSRHPQKLKLLVATEEWLKANEEKLKSVQDVETIDVTEEELAKVSFLCHPQHVLAVFEKLVVSMDIDGISDRLTLVLDGIQDPGNLGTIIRIADWFGIENVVCSKDTADVFNPKVIQATMGSISRVNVIYVDLAEFFSSLPTAIPIYGTLLEGENIYSQSLSRNGIIVMGNEGKGLSPTVRKLITHALRIPSYPEGRPTAESLNVAIATAIVCAEFRRDK